MKIRILFLSITQAIFCFGSAIAEEEKNHELIQYNIVILDQDKSPVKQASVKVFNYSDEDVVQPKGVTDLKGIVNIVSRKTLLSEVSVDRDGYYSARSLVVPKSFYSSVDKKAKSFQVELKKINNPIGLYAKKLTSEGGSPLKIPVELKEVSYDFLVGDWVAPHGKGKISDLVFFYESKFLNDEEYGRKISVRFSNEKDGIIPFEAPLHKGSVFVSDYEAPSKGYLPKWIQTTDRTPGKPHQSTRKDERNFYFRVRTQLDEAGNIESAHYGKIYGDFMSFIYYFNPVSNNRNVEFDPRKNLFSNLHWKEKVDRP